MIEREQNIEGHIVAHVVARVAVYRQRQPPLLDVRHADAHLRPAAHDHRCIGDQPAVSDHIRQVVHVRNVVDQWPVGRLRQA
jgi:hypothetical protein